VPTIERIKHAVWHPANPPILASTAFRVGWTPNAAALVGLLRGVREASA
jgi:hypothetical protein